MLEKVEGLEQLQGKIGSNQAALGFLKVCDLYNIGIVLQCLSSHAINL